VRKLTVVAALALLALPGCCGGGIDRCDSRSSLAYTVSVLGVQTCRDVRATADTVTGVPAALARDVSQFPERVGSAWSLYCGR